MIIEWAGRAGFSCLLCAVVAFVGGAVGEWTAKLRNERCTSTWVLAGHAAHQAIPRVLLVTAWCYYSTGLLKCYNHIFNENVITD